MIFNSITFFFFLAVFLPLYWNVRSSRRNLLLLVGSYVFYGWWDWRFLSLIAASTVVDFVVAKQISSRANATARQRLLWLSVLFNLGVLAVFKYFNFFVDSLVGSLDAVGVNLTGPTINVLLPVGISFYTFQTISYSFDVYRGKLPAADSILDFATYVAYFPQLVAGPIERASHLLPQIIDPDARRFPEASQRLAAGRLILGGLFKKVVLADGVAPVANAAFDDPSRWSFVLLIVGIVAFAIQIYGDFAGYSDIARGVSLLLGINLVINFTEPYLSRNITEFWRRWHISLSNWLRDYLYIPLGGNRGGPSRTYRNLMLTMLLGGLWHGASFNFVIWGALHGAFLSIHRLRGSGDRSDAIGARDLPRIIGTFATVNFAWVFFRAETFGGALEMLGAIATLQDGELPVGHLITVLTLGSITFGLDCWQRFASPPTAPLGAEESPRTRRTFPALSGASAAAAIVAILVFSGGTPQPFLYFQF